MMPDKKYFLLFPLLLLLFYNCGNNSAAKQTGTNDTNITIAMFGDQGTTDNSKKVLQMVKSEGTELLIINGDFDYKNDPKAWQQMNETILGKNFPVVAVAGNHDMPSWQEYQTIVAQWEKHPGLSCSGIPGVETTCVYKGITIVSTTPGLFNDLNHTQYIDNALFGKTGWKICSWHKNMAAMQTGGKGDATGWGVYEACRKNSALITTGHEHAYARTFLLSNIEHQTIADFNQSDMTIEKGKTVVVLSGLGGISSRPLIHDGAWWANKQNANTGATAGAFFCTFRIAGHPDVAECYFKDIYKGVLDRFTLRLSQ